jgi:hypothetical protein
METLAAIGTCDPPRVAHRCDHQIHPESRVTYGAPGVRAELVLGVGSRGVDEITTQPRLQTGSLLRVRDGPVYAAGSKRPHLAS